MDATQFEFDRNAVITIQGGGTHGLTLLGQLSAVFQAEFNVLAIAGSSAGAVIAALIWAGWSPHSLRDRLAEFARQKTLITLPGAFEPANNPFDLRAWTTLCRDIANMCSTAVSGNLQGRGIRALLTKAWMFFGMASLFGQIAPHYETLGCFRGNSLECNVEKLMREALAGRGCGNNLPATPLTFGDFRALSERHPEIYFPPLLLAATNLGTQDVELINSLDQRYENVSVARAVRASAGYPIFFRPVDLPGVTPTSLFIDGGVISNFPAWAFSDEFREKLHASETYRALAYRPWVHIGLRLVDEDVKPRDGGEVLPIYDDVQLQHPPTFIAALRRLLFGQARNRLEDMISSTLARSIIVAQPYEQSGGPDNILDIDAINERRVHVMFAAGNRFASTRFQLVSFSTKSDQLIRGILTSIVQRAHTTLDPQGAQPGLRIRANIFLPSRGQLKIVFAANMQNPATGADDSDVAMVFDRPNQGLTGFCYTLRLPLICNLGAIQTHVATAGQTLFRMTTAQQKLVLRDRTWLSSMPILDPNDMTYRKSLQPSDALALPERFASHFGAMMDGPIFGVLNVDANLEYASLRIDPNPDVQTQDDRIITVVDMMRVAALQLGQIFASEFAASS